MNRQRVKSQINLEELAGGAFAEKLNEALMQVAENIQNPNTEATTKRQINITLKFAPNKSRQVINTQISVTTKLAATEAIDTQMVMGLNLRTGQIEIAEYDGQIRGQMNLSQYAEEQMQQEQAEEPAEVTTEQEDPVPTGKPLDLKNRHRQQAAEKGTSAATGDLIPGRDFDPDTGEVYETAGQSADDQKNNRTRVVSIGHRAAQA